MAGLEAKHDLPAVGERLERQIDFILEIDKAKGILRNTLITDGSRRENDAEHSWHVALMALILTEYSATPVDPAKAAAMLLVHDLVEIDAGDTLIYDEAARAEQTGREAAAAERIFNLLPPDQAREVRALWNEYEARATPEARFAFALDRLQPLLHNYRTRGAAWKAHGIKSEQVIRINSAMEEGAPALWGYARRLIQDAVREGFLEE